MQDTQSIPATSETAEAAPQGSRLAAPREQAVKFIEVAPGHHIPATTAIRKLEKRIVRLTAQAITDYGMISDGDKVMVAMSGGKDSAYLADLLKETYTSTSSPYTWRRAFREAPPKN